MTTAFASTWGGASELRYRFHANPIDAVFVAIERHQATIGRQSCEIDRREHKFRPQSRERGHSCISDRGDPLGFGKVSGYSGVIH